MFDPNPLKWWRIVVQAKRYTNTVWISAVRDLHSAVVTEWANKWILVTTATFWPDSYKYVAEKNLPITLVDGSRLLGLLQNHWYNARINIEEAKIELKK
jgi:restriction system protein